MQTPKIPVSVLIVTKNAAAHIPRCLAALGDFSEVIVIDSNSADNTQNICSQYGVRFENFIWNGRYPKKRQYVLDHIPVANDWCLFVDADEEMTPELSYEITNTIAHTSDDAFFIKGAPVFEKAPLDHGRWNNKITLFRKGTIHFPVMNDAVIAAMGEIEGHYQPVVVGSIGQLYQPLLHHTFESNDEWVDRHQRYAEWQAKIETRGIDVAKTEKGYRRALKTVFQSMPFRSVAAFADSFILNAGFLDGSRGYRYAKRRAEYYSMIESAKKASGNGVAPKMR